MRLLVGPADLRQALGVAEASAAARFSYAPRLLRGLQATLYRATHPSLMGLADRLRLLDGRAMTSLRQPGEPAEAFLRRVAGRQWPSGRRLPVEVQQALTEYSAQQDAR